MVYLLRTRMIETTSVASVKNGIPHIRTITFNTITECAAYYHIPESRIRQALKLNRRWRGIRFTEKEGSITHSVETISVDYKPLLEKFKASLEWKEYSEVCMDEEDFDEGFKRGVATALQR